MVETQDIEVYAIEQTMLTETVMETLLQSQVTEIVLLNNGTYTGVYSRNQHKIMTGKIYTRGVYGIFESARAFFSRPENREQRLALLDSKGQLLTFLVWNQRAERNSRYLASCRERLLELLCRGYDILFEDWNEYTAEYVHFLSEQGDYSDQMFLYGRNWELDAAYGRYTHIESKDKSVIVVGKDGISYPTEERLVYPLMKMKEEYQHKSLYFYMDMNRHICCFTAKFLGEFGCVPDGFCELHDQREMESFLGKAVEDVELVARKPEALIVFIDQTDKNVLAPYVEEEKLVCYYDLFGFAAELVEKKFFQTWGEKEQVYALMKEMYFKNLHIPYRNYKDKDEVDGILLWEVLRDKSPARYRQYMEKINNNVNLYSVYPLYETRWSATTTLFIKNFQEAMDKGKKIILYGIRSHYTSQWMHILQMFGMSFQIMDEQEQEDWFGYPVISVHELPFYDIGNVLLINNQPYGDLPRTVKLLTSYGISKENRNCVSLYEEIDRTDRGANMIDICAGPICELLAKQPIPGYVTIGENKNDDYRIMVVGGSTADSAFYQYSSWPEELFDIFEREGKCVTIYNGGMAGALSVQELSKLLRDVQELKPDMVISFSGFNDSCDQKLTDGYVNGVYTAVSDDNRNWFHNWFENEKKMAAVASAHQAKFYCFAQPMLYMNENLNFYDLLATKYVRRTWHPDMNWRSKVMAIRDYPWFVDIMDILQDKPEVFFDCCHVTTEGNRIIAQHIYEHIKDDIIFS